ncbi:MAG: hypothetical protein ABI306_09095 [Caulobacteraceae bacterium]
MDGTPEMPGRSQQFKVTVKFERRGDGGLRAWSPDVPGLVLSNLDPDKVMADIEPAMEAILSERLGCKVRAHRLAKIGPSVTAATARPGTGLGRRRTLEFAAACA